MAISLYIYEMTINEKKIDKEITNRIQFIANWCSKLHPAIFFSHTFFSRCISIEDMNTKKVITFLYFTLSNSTGHNSISNAQFVGYFFFHFIFYIHASKSRRDNSHFSFANCNIKWKQCINQHGIRSLSHCLLFISLRKKLKF